MGELFEISNYEFSGKVLYIYGYQEFDGYQGKVEYRQGRLKFYWYYMKGRNQLYSWLKKQKATQGAKTLGEALTQIIGTRIFVNQRFIERVG